MSRPPGHQSSSASVVRESGTSRLPAHGSSSASVAGKSGTSGPHGHESSSASIVCGSGTSGPPALGSFPAVVMRTFGAYPGCLECDGPRCALSRQVLLNDRLGPLPCGDRCPRWKGVCGTRYTSCDRLEDLVWSKAARRLFEMGHAVTIMDDDLSSNGEDRFARHGRSRC